MTSYQERLRLIAEVLGSPADSAHPDAISRIVAAAGSPRHRVSYLILAVLQSEIPDATLVKTFTRTWRSHGLERVLRRRPQRPPNGPLARLPIRVVRGTVIDLTDTSASKFITGIQRVARETVSRWRGIHDLTLVRWDGGGRGLVTLEEEDATRLAGPAVTDVTSARELVIPYEATLVLPEIAVNGRRAARLRSIARNSGGRSVAVAFDCIPITSSETAGVGMPGAFSKYLSALARFDVVAPISEAAAVEYRGWRRMLAGAGLSGPEIVAVSLPFTTSGESDPERAEELRKQLGLGDAPIVLCVGSHEPRKNHLALLHACERVWREGHEFSLVLVGGNAWETRRFDLLVEYLRGKDRRILTLSGVDDDVVWDLYDLARFSVFPSLNEGFGLPVVESLSHGTPVITSNFGSMLALGETGGALMVDPRNIDEIADAISSLVQDDDLVARLRQESTKVAFSSWDDYADAVWQLAHPELAQSS